LEDSKISGNSGYNGGNLIRDPDLGFQIWMQEFFLLKNVADV